jgi:hypothetical protein
MTPETKKPIELEEEELNEKTLAYIRWQENPHIWSDQDENGVDLTRLRENLKLSPAERLEHNEPARYLAIVAKEAGERYRAAQRNRQSIL